MELLPGIQGIGNSKELQKSNIVSQGVRGNVSGKSQGFPQKQCAYLEGTGEDEIEINESTTFELLQDLDENECKFEEPSEKIVAPFSLTTHTVQVGNEVPSGKIQNFNVFKNLDLIRATWYETIYIGAGEKEKCTTEKQYNNLEDAESDADRNVNSFDMEEEKIVHTTPLKRVFHFSVKMAEGEFEISQNVQESTDDFMDSFEEFLVNNLAEVSKIVENNLVTNEMVTAKVRIPKKHPTDESDEVLLDSLNIGIQVVPSNDPSTQAPAIKESNEKIHLTGAGSEIDSLIPENVKFSQIHSNNNIKLVGIRNEAPNSHFLHLEDTQSDVMEIPGENVEMKGTQVHETDGHSFVADDFSKSTTVEEKRTQTADVEDGTEKHGNQREYDDFEEFPDDTEIVTLEVPDEVEVSACRSFIAEEMDAMLLEPSKTAIEQEEAGKLVSYGDCISDELKCSFLADGQENMERSEATQRTCGKAKESGTSEEEVVEQFQGECGGRKLVSQDIQVENAEVQNNGELSETMEVEVRNEVTQFTICAAKPQGGELKNVNIPTEEDKGVIDNKVEVFDTKTQDDKGCEVHKIIDARGVQYIVVDETSIIEETQTDEHKDNEELCTANKEKDGSVEGLNESRKRLCDDLEEFGPRTKIIKLDMNESGGDINRETNNNEDHVKSEETDQKTAPEIITIDLSAEETPDTVVISDDEESAELTKETQKRKCDNTAEHAPSPKVAKMEPVQVQSDNFRPRPIQITKSRPNPTLARIVLGNPMTASWLSRGHVTSHRSYKLCNLIPQSAEYEQVRKIFKKTATRRMAVGNIYRVENPYLLGLYLRKKEKMERTCEQPHQVIERQLFHGTREENIDGICRHNFDWRRRGQSRGHKFGQGVSFSPKASYARHYNFGDDVMFLARVLVSRMMEGNCETVVPPEPYDTTRNRTGDVIVKYNDDDFYPQYIIYYYYRQGCGFFFNF